MKCYYELVDDIKSGKLEFIQLRQIQSNKISVTSDYSIRIQSTKKETNHEVHPNKLYKLYTEYPTLQELEDIKKLEPIREIIGGGSPSYYWGVLHEVLRRKEKCNITEDTTSQLTLIDIKIYIKPGIDIESSRGRAKYPCRKHMREFLLLNISNIRK